MDESRIRQMVRQFPENGLKHVLTRAANVRDLLTLARAAVLPRLDFRALQVDPTTYVTAEYRHVSSDLVLTLPLLPSVKGRRKKKETRRWTAGRCVSCLATTSITGSSAARR